MITLATFTQRDQNQMKRYIMKVLRNDCRVVRNVKCAFEDLTLRTIHLPVYILPISQAEKR